MGTSKYRDWTDEELDQELRAVTAEQERRANLSRIPNQVAAMVKTYRDGGGDEQALADALGEESRDG